MHLALVLLCSRYVRNVELCKHVEGGRRERPCRLTSSSRNKKHPSMQMSHKVRTTSVDQRVVTCVNTEQTSFFFCLWRYYIVCTFCADKIFPNILIDFLHSSMCKKKSIPGNTFRTSKKVFFSLSHPHTRTDQHRNFRENSFSSPAQNMPI